MNKTFFASGILLGVTAISLGAFGAHGLKPLLGSVKLATFETGVKYQMYHALFLLVLGQATWLSDKLGKGIFLLTIAGILLFSCSLYLLATNELTGFDFRIIGFVTPVGGILLIFAWLLLGYGVWRLRK